MSDVTQLLRTASTGDARAAADLLPLVYDELRRLAAHRLAGERNEHTLQPTALVHEAWLRVSGDDERTWNGRQHFFAAADVLGLAVPTAKQWWAYSRAWLRVEIAGKATGEAP